MTRAELAECRRIAQDSSIDLSGEDDSALHGCGLPEFEPVTVSPRTVAKFLRWQCCTLSGGWDSSEYDDIARYLCTYRRAHLA